MGNSNITIDPLRLLELAHAAAQSAAQCSTFQADKIFTGQPQKVAEAYVDAYLEARRRIDAFNAGGAKSPSDWRL